MHRIGTAVRWRNLATAAFILAMAAPALACPVCFSAGNDNVLRAFYVSTATLTLLPLLIFGAVAGWLWRRMRGAAPERRADLFEV